MSDTRKKIADLLRHHFQVDQLDMMVERLFDLWEEQSEQDRQNAWDEGYGEGLEEGESNASEDYDTGYEQGYDDGFRQGEHNNLEFY